MALERRNPLPAGRYWINVIGDKFFIMEGWLKAVAPFVHVENQHLTPATGFDPTSGPFGHSGPPLLPGPDVIANSTPQIMWYLFTTSKALPWVGPVLGFPNIAPGSVTSEADTVDRPPVPKGPLDDFFKNLPSGEGLGSLALLALLAYAEFGGKK